MQEDERAHWETVHRKAAAATVEYTEEVAVPPPPVEPQSSAVSPIPRTSSSVASPGMKFRIPIPLRKFF